MASPAPDRKAPSRDQDGSKDVSTALHVLAVAAACAAVAHRAYASYWGALTLVLNENQILQAFFASSALGLASYVGLSVWWMVTGWIRSRTHTSVSIKNDDPVYDKVIDYIGKQSLAETGALTARTFKKEKTWKEWRKEFTQGDRAPPAVEYRPASNNEMHVILYRGKKILMHRKQGETITTGWERKPMMLETLTLSSWGMDNHLIKQLIDDAVGASFQQQSDEVNIFTQCRGWPGGFEKAMSKKPRSIESVILDQNLANELLEDARDFLRSSEWYASVGIPYRRGYLLHGPPGCGKTSFCQALAGELKLDLCMLTLADKNLDDTALAENLREAPANSIVLLEDVDAVFVERSVQSDSKSSGVTFSGLLNAIDGVASQEGRLFFMTTNHKEKLDPALIRPGRCDVKVELKRASRSMAQRLFRNFFPGEPADLAAEFAGALPEDELTMAQLQGHLLEYKTAPSLAIQNVPRLLRASKPVDVDQMPVHEHLFRVGLEQWAPTFEQRGFRLKADLKDLSIEAVKKWSPMLRYNDNACGRMNRLLTGEAHLLADYQLADMATAKDLFTTTFADFTTMGGTGGDDRGAGAARFSDQDMEDALELGRLGDQLCRVVQRGGKAAVSIWQLRRHLHAHRHDAAEAVQTASVLLKDAQGTYTDTVDSISTAEWLSRCCLGHLAPAFAKAGYSAATSLYGLGKDDLAGTMKITDAHTQNVLLALLEFRDQRADLLAGFSCVDQVQIRGMFLRRFPAAPPSAVGLFTAALSDELGHGRVSFMQLSAHLAQEGLDAETCAAGARAQAQQLGNTAAPAPELDDTPCWAAAWMAEQGMAEHAGCLLEQGFRTKADLLEEPMLGAQELRELGVAKMRDQRRLANAIAALKPKEAPSGAILRDNSVDGA